MILKSLPLIIFSTTTALAAPHDHSDSSHPNRRTISVMGSCLTRIAQDRTAITFTSTNLAKSSQEASRETIQAHEAIKAEIKKLGLPDVIFETAHYSVHEECVYNEMRRACSGFRSRLSTRVETSDIARVGEVIGVASRLGVDEVSDLQMVVSPELMQREREGCLERATRNAAAKAAKIAQGAGVALGRVRSISEGAGDSGNVPVPFERAYGVRVAAADGAPQASIEARPVDVSVEIVAVYEIDEG
jgi:uncharacterized protein YggE